MIYLSSFSLPSQDDEYHFLNSHIGKNLRTCYTTKYPFGIFYSREMLKNFSFSDITIFCGNNGCGKSTVLNVISEKLSLKRTTPFNRSDFFEDYISLCRYETERIVSPDSKVITSDDVFDRVLDIRRINDGIDNKRESLINEWVENQSPAADSKLHGIDDYDRWKKIADSRNRNLSQSQFIRSRLMRNITERSNGESALSFFVDAIHDNALYILDEPENSLSPSNQLELKYFLEDCARHHGCQFIISTHSPFLLSLKGAKIYDMDASAASVSDWKELECVKIYKDFFEKFC